MTEQQLLNEFKSMEEDSSFISEKSVEFGQKYAKKFIAVKDKQVVAIGEDFEKVIEEVKQKGLDPSLVLVQYIPTKDEIIFCQEPSE